MAKRALYEKWKVMVNAVTDEHKESNFMESGKMTPEEFVEAGDKLTQMCRSWKWVAGEPSVQPFLPADKKHLMLRDAPSYTRATTMMDVEGGLGEPDEDGWTCTHKDHKVSATRTNFASAPEAKEESKEEQDEFKETWSTSSEEDEARQETTGPEEKYRVYNLSITYDKYYASPRVYLFGFSEDDHTKPLSQEELMEDVYSENRGETVTVDEHPFLHKEAVSIHPCRHAETMHRMVQRMKLRLEEEAAEAGEKMDGFVYPTYLSLTLFLKFFSSVVPTISYDVTMDIDI